MTPGPWLAVRPRPGRRGRPLSAGTPCRATGAQIYPPAPAAGRCRMCGCTDREACVTRWGMPTRGRPTTNLVERTRLSVPREVCQWVEADLCSRCAPHERAPTRRQLHELARIAARHGDVQTGALSNGHVWISWLDRQEQPRTVELDRAGRAVDGLGLARVIAGAARRGLAITSAGARPDTFRGDW